MSTHTGLEKIFGQAISREEASNKFYASLARRAKNRAVQELFETLAKEELDHKTLLLKLQAEPMLQSKINAPADYRIAESEAVPEITDVMPPRDAVAVAMKKEQQAVEMYRWLAQSATEANVRTLFENLMNMELGHKGKLEALFVDVGFPEAF